MSDSYSPPLGRVFREHTLAITAVLSVIGYALVVGALLGYIPDGIVPRISLSNVILITDAIAVVNTVATLLLVVGWHWIRRGEVRKHRAAMSGSFGLILLFLVLYLTKIIGGGKKEFVGPDLAYAVYIAMLAVHIILSMVAVPVVLYALILGLSHTPRELREETPHRRVGRIAAASWIVSLTLGVVAYLLLNHIYDWEFSRSILLLALAVPAVGAGGRDG